jgi:hypothetical protein
VNGKINSKGDVMNDQALNSPEAGVSPLGIGVPRPTRIGKVRLILLLGFLIALTTAGSCNSETLFKSDFDATAINQPPAPQQAVGTVTVDGGVRVAQIPDTNSKGVRFSFISGSGDAVLHCNLSKPPRDGTYVFSTFLFFPLPGVGGVTTIQFEGGGKPFLHLDISPSCRAGENDPGNCFRIDDDDSTKFGKYQLNQLFIVQVTLTINDSPTAHVVISGAGASGEATRTVSPPFRLLARQFSVVRISPTLSADEQEFFATNILVTRKS